MDIHLTPEGDQHDDVESDIKNRILSILQTFGALTFQGGDVHFKDDGLLNSIKMLRFFMLVQKEFGIKFNPSDITDNDVYRLSSLVKFVHRRLL